MDSEIVRLEGTSSQRYRNGLEIQLFGLRRSGNHGFVAWLSQQYRQPVVHLNNAKAFHDPYVNFFFARIPNAVPFRKQNSEKVELVRAASKELLLISYEDMRLSKLAKLDVMPKHDEWVGASKSIQR